MKTRKVQKARRGTESLRSPISSRWTQIGFAVLFLHLLLSGILFSRAMLNSFEPLKLALLLTAGLTLAALGMMALIQRPRWVDIRRGFLSEGHARWACVGLLLFLLSAILSTIFSVSPATSWRGFSESSAGLISLLGCFSIFWATRFLVRSRQDIERLLLALIMASIVVLGYGILQLLGLDPFEWKRVSLLDGKVRPFSTLGHPNYLAKWLIMAIPIVAYFTWQSWKSKSSPWKLCSLLTLTILMTIGVVLTLSRGAMIAMIGAAVFFVITAFPTARRRIVQGLLALTVLAVLILIWKPTLANAVIARGGKLEDAPRLHVWAGSWQVFKEYPITGCGLDTYSFAFAKHQSPKLSWLEWGHYQSRAHNEVLHILATQGLVGFLALGVFVVGLGFCASRAIRHTDPSQRILSICVCTALVGFAIHSLVSFTIIATAVVFFTLSAVLTRLAEKSDSPSPIVAKPGLFRGWRVTLQLLVGLIAIWLGFQFVAQPVMAQLTAGEAETLAKASSFDKAIERYQEARRLDPHQAIFSRLLAQTWRKKGLSERNVADLQNAVKVLEQETARAPADPEAQALLATLLDQLAQRGGVNPDKALQQIQVALTRAPNHPQYLLNAAGIALRAGRLNEATSYAKVAERLYPVWARPATLLSLLALARRDLKQADYWLAQGEKRKWLGDQRARWEWKILKARSCLRHNLIEQAQELAEAALKTMASPAPLLILAEIAERKRDREKALTLYSKVLQLMPTNRLARNGLRRLQASP